MKKLKKLIQELKQGKEPKTDGFGEEWKKGLVDDAVLGSMAGAIKTTLKITKNGRKKNNSSNGV